MRWLKYSFLFWLIAAPAFYFVGLPKLLIMLQTKARSETFAQCQDQMKTNHMAYVPLAIMKPEVADTYCHCVGDGLTLQRDDLFELAQHKQPARLTAEMNNVVDTCNVGLQESMKQAIGATPPPPIVPEINSTKDANGTETVTFN